MLSYLDLNPIDETERAGAISHPEHTAAIRQEAVGLGQ
jgi:hypothetical protein